MFGDMHGDFKYQLYYSFLLYYAEKNEIHSKYLLVIIVWMNKFQTPKIRAVLSSYFCEGNDIARGSNRGDGWRVGSI